MIDKFNKIAQMKIYEMIFMIVGVILFFALAGLFAVSLFSSNLHKQATNSAADRALVALTNLAESPEFSCTNEQPNCIDADKLIFLVNNSDYKDFWPFSSLSILRESGLNKTESELVECNENSYPNCDIFNVFSKGVHEKTASTYVALCLKQGNGLIIYDKCEIARIIAGSEIK